MAHIPFEFLQFIKFSIPGFGWAKTMSRCLYCFSAFFGKGVSSLSALFAFDPIVQSWVVII